VKCGNCNGNGESFDGDYCRECGGSGRVLDKVKTHTVRLPYAENYGVADAVEDIREILSTLGVSFEVVEHDVSVSINYDVEG